MDSGRAREGVFRESFTVPFRPIDSMRTQNLGSTNRSIHIRHSEALFYGKISTESIWLVRASASRSTTLTPITSETAVSSSCSPASPGLRV